MTREEAIALAESKFWETMSIRDRAMFQLFEPKLCMPFDVFHEALEKTLARPIFTHEFGFPEAVQHMKDEMLHGIPPPTLEEVLNLIPADKRIIVMKGDSDEKGD